MHLTLSVTDDRDADLDLRRAFFPALDDAPGDNIIRIRIIDEDGEPVVREKRARLQVANCSPTRRVGTQSGRAPIVRRSEFAPGSSAILLNYPHPVLGPEMDDLTAAGRVGEWSRGAGSARCIPPR